MAVGERRVVGARLAGRDRGIHLAVEPLERVGEALGVAGRVVAPVAQLELVGPVAMADPQLLRRLRVPRERALGPVDLPAQPVLAAGRYLADGGDAARAAAE